MKQLTGKLSGSLSSGGLSSITFSCKPRCGVCGWIKKIIKMSEILYGNMDTKMNECLWGLQVIFTLVVCMNKCFVL